MSFAIVTLNFFTSHFQHKEYFKFDKCSSDQLISLLIKQLWHASLLTAHILISQDLDSSASQVHLIKPTICVLTCAWICTIRVCWGHASWLQSSVQTLVMVYSPKEKGSFQPLSFLTGLQCTGPRMNRSSHHVWPTFSHNAAFADLSDRPFSQHTFDSS